MLEEYSEICPDYALYSCQDMMAMEDEVLELLYAFVRATKPRRVVEIGTYRGWTASRIGHALKKNTIGECFTYETDGTLANTARMICEDLPVTVIWDDANNHITDHNDGAIDLLIIDGSSERGARYRDYRLWAPKVTGRGFIWIHDALKGGDERQETEARSPDHRLLFWTPRGLAVIQKSNF